MADDSYQDAGFDPADDFELAEAIGGAGIDDFAQTVGQAIAQQMQAQQAPSREAAHAAANEAHARDIIARHPELGTDEGARTAITGLARVLASLIVAVPYVLADLAEVEEQRIVEVALLSATSRHDVFDPVGSGAGSPTGGSSMGRCGQTSRLRDDREMKSA